MPASCNSCIEILQVPFPLQKGMLLLGFKEAADPVAMTCLLQDIDEDRTGTITEGESLLRTHLSCLVTDNLCAFCRGVHGLLRHSKQKTHC